MPLDRINITAHRAGEELIKYSSAPRSHCAASLLKACNTPKTQRAALCDVIRTETPRGDTVTWVWKMMDNPAANKNHVPCHSWVSPNGWSTSSTQGALLDPLGGSQHLGLGSSSEHRSSYEHLQGPSCVSGPSTSRPPTTCTTLPCTKPRTSAATQQPARCLLTLRSRTMECSSAGPKTLRFSYPTTCIDLN
ncbi:unnamed protein product [Pleuronectes platessa]|uniref:Uncharacterized protein n=1 Tax=Pleuronectes platessa TaxID=8262 RepID=A0A9N7ZF29_PLEPL|nr:unnamed protein product [Pleuronectes platessa]